MKDAVVVTLKSRWTHVLMLALVCLFFGSRYSDQVAQAVLNFIS